MPPRLKSQKTDVTPPEARDLLAWYDRHRRRMPWRALPGVSADPYAVWLSEIMLQQTTVTAVKPYFEAFLARWPTVEALSAAPVADVMAAWAGLGYYARARNLYKCAGVVATAHGGRFPSTEAELLELPGVGPYTAAAIAAIAFGRVATVVDGNVERVMARLFAVTAPLPGSKVLLKELAASLTPSKRAGDYAQGVMDLGATVCTPKSPKCMICPWAPSCVGRIKGIAETLPRKAPKAESPQRYGVAFWMERKDGSVFLQERGRSSSSRTGGGAMARTGRRGHACVHPLPPRPESLRRETHRRASQGVEGRGRGLGAGGPHGQRGAAQRHGQSG
jgi:A/G-specific adenine glycosylase